MKKRQVFLSETAGPTLSIPFHSKTPAASSYKKLNNKPTSRVSASLEAELMNLFMQPVWGTRFQCSRDGHQFSVTFGAQLYFSNSASRSFTNSVFLGFTFGSRRFGARRTGNR